MADTPRLFEDLSRVASGAMGTVVGMRDEAEAQLRQRLERVLERMDVVPREEFEVAREMAAKARQEQEAMADRLAALEARVAELEKAGARAAGAAAKRAPAKASGKASGAAAKGRSSGADTSNAKTSGTKASGTKASGGKASGGKGAGRRGKAASQAGEG